MRSGTAADSDERDSVVGMVREFRREPTDSQFRAAGADVGNVETRRPTRFVSRYRGTLNES